MASPLRVSGAPVAGFPEPSWRSVPSHRSQLLSSQNARLGALSLVGSDEACPDPEHAREGIAVEDATRPSGLPVFSRLEAMVVHVGKKDPLPFFSTDGRMARMRRKLFGWRPPTPFADPRLEALRLVVIALRKRKRSPQVAIDAALQAGVTQLQIDLLISEIRPPSEI